MPHKKKNLSSQIAETNFDKLFVVSVLAFINVLGHRKCISIILV